jgi:TolB-like protein/Tfp pilus assembly protein PilF
MGSSAPVFLSYASEDAEPARHICGALEAAGLEVWFDQSALRGGDAWDASIRQRIKECSLFVPIISANTNARSEGYFRLEWKLAVDRSHLIADDQAFLLPVVIDATLEANARVPEKFREVQWTHLPSGATPAAFAERVRHLLSDGGTPQRTTAGAAAVSTGLGALVPTNGPSSIAVLPFVNRSHDREDEYFSDGLADELLNVLAKIPGLRVAARISSFQFKDRNEDIAVIGRKLNVATVLEGSVRKAGNRMRISVQLVKVPDGYHLWSETYDRTLEDIFAVQDDIAQSVVKELRTTLLGEAVGAKADVKVMAQVAAAVKGRSTDADAYRLYLRGRNFLVGNQQEMDKSIDYFRQAVARAPDYALAHAGLAEAYTRQAFLRGANRAGAVENARDAVARALELDPELAEAHTALGMVRYYFEWDWAGAEAEFRRALDLNPGSLAVHEEYGAFLTSMRRLDEGLAESREASRLDPLSVGPVHDMAINALIRHDYEEAAAGFRRAVDIDPNWAWGYIKLARTLAMQKKCQDAFAQAEIAERRIAGGVAPLSQSWLGVTYATCGDGARARQKLDYLHELAEKQYVDPVTFAAVHSALGEMDEALHWYEKSFEDRTPNMVYAAIGPRISPELVGNQRYASIVERMRFPRASG